MKVDTEAPDEASSFETFFRSAWPGAYRLAAFLTQDAGAAEEIAQEALARMFSTWPRADRPEAYLRVAVVNASRNWRRHNKTVQAKLPLLVTPESVDLAADDLADAVAALPFRQRAVIVLRYHFGLSEVEIADAIGCRPGTVKSLSSRALAQLRKVLSP